MILLNNEQTGNICREVKFTRSDLFQMLFLPQSVEEIPPNFEEFKRFSRVVLYVIPESSTSAFFSQKDLYKQ